MHITQKLNKQMQETTVIVYVGLEGIKAMLLEEMNSTNKQRNAEIVIKKERTHVPKRPCFLGSVHCVMGTMDTKCTILRYKI